MVDAVFLAEADAVFLAEDAPLLHQAVETSAAAVHSPRLPEDSMAALAADARITAVVGIMAVVRITAAGDITVQDLDSGCTRLTAMRLPCVILQASMMPMASGSIIQVARFRTDIES